MNLNRFKENNKNESILISVKLSVKLKPHNRLYLVSKSLYDIYSMIKGRFHVLPDFLIFAIGRAGTTSLYEGIMEHPDVYRPTMREIYFFDKTQEQSYTDYG